MKIATSVENDFGVWIGCYELVCEDRRCGVNDGCRVAQQLIELSSAYVAIAITDTVGLPACQPTPSGHAVGVFEENVPSLVYSVAILAAHVEQLH